MADELLPAAITTKKRKTTKARFGRRVRGGKQKVSATYIAWNAHYSNNTPIPAIPPVDAHRKGSTTKKQLIVKLSKETSLRLMAEAGEEKERREKEKHATITDKVVKKNLDICAVLRDTRSKLRKTQGQLGTTTTKLQSKDKELVENNIMWNEEVASVVAASQAALDMKLAKRDREHTRGTEKKVKVSLVYAINSNATHTILSRHYPSPFT